MPFAMERPVLFGDVDPAGIVYYPRLVGYLHEGMEGYFAAEAGIDYPVLVGEHRLGLATVRLEVDFRGPVRYGDTVRLEAEIVRVGRSSVEWRYRIAVPGGDTALEARIVTVLIDMDSAAKRELPSWLRERLVADAADVGAASAVAADRGEG